MRMHNSGFVGALVAASLGVSMGSGTSEARAPARPPRPQKKEHAHSREIARRLRQEARAAEKRAARGSKPVRVETGTGSIEDESRAEGLAQNTPES